MIKISAPSNLKPINILEEASFAIKKQATKKLAAKNRMVSYLFIDTKSLQMLKDVDTTLAR